MRKNAIAGFLFAIVVFCGCGTDVNLPNYRNTPRENPARENLSGFYEVNMAETENTCAVSEHPLDIWIWMSVVSQNRQDEDGNDTYNIFVGNLLWLETGIAPDGYFEDTEILAENATNDISGVITPEEITADIAINMVDAETGETLCFISYSVDGYLLFERNTDTGQLVSELEAGEGYGYETLSGYYENYIVQTTNSCSPGFSPWRETTWTSVIVQKRFGDGSYLVDIFINLWVGFFSAPNTLIAPDGFIYATDLLNTISGTLTPDSMTATIRMTMITLEYVCFLAFEISGYPLFERAVPPERFENR